MKTEAESNNKNINKWIKVALWSICIIFVLLEIIQIRQSAAEENAQRIEYEEETKEEELNEKKREMIYEVSSIINDEYYEAHSLIPDYINEVGNHCDWIDEHEGADNLTDYCLKLRKNIYHDSIESRAVNAEDYIDDNGDAESILKAMVEEANSNYSNLADVMQDYTSDLIDMCEIDHWVYAGDGRDYCYESMESFNDYLIDTEPFNSQDFEHLI